MSFVAFKAAAHVSLRQRGDRAAGDDAGGGPEHRRTGLRRLLARGHFLKGGQGDQLSIFVKIAKNVAQSFFVKINAELFTEEKISPKFGILISFSKFLPKVNNSTLKGLCRNFAPTLQGLGINFSCRI
jgi:hypothetical protein